MALQVAAVRLHDAHQLIFGEYVRHLASQTENTHMPQVLEAWVQQSSKQPGDASPASGMPVVQLMVATDGGRPAQQAWLSCVHHRSTKHKYYSTQASAAALWRRTCVEDVVDVLQEALLLHLVVAEQEHSRLPGTASLQPPNTQHTVLAAQ